MSMKQSCLQFFLSNRVELLADKLAEVISVPLSSAFAQETIVVQSRGMERWLSMELARHHGICANCLFPFPNAMVKEIFHAVLPELPDHDPFEPSVMTWKIMKSLPVCIHREGFEMIRSYFGEEGDTLKRFQLAERVAALFDQYVLFRPEMVLGWEKGGGKHWQAVLWRMVTKESATPHRAAMKEAFFTRVKNESPDPILLPERISVFGISALPRFHLEVLREISRFLPVNVFLMNPCREYWGDIVSEREARTIARRYRKHPVSPDLLHLQPGNELLASLGRVGKDFFELVHVLEGEEHDLFVDPPAAHLLACVQSDILALLQRGGEGGERTVVAEDDRSIVIHSCHSPMREVEVLYDTLLSLFEEDPSLMPKDILVMMPAVEVYTPFIQAVFDTPPKETMRIPHSIADRSIRGESQILTVFLALLDLCGSRFEASSVLSVLEAQAVHQRFGLTEADVDLIKRWVEESGIRWGIDQETRIRHGLPEFPENTWRFGLDRLLLGYAMVGGEEQIFEGVLPYDLMEGDQSTVLGHFLDFTTRLFRTVTELENPRSLTQWGNLLLGLVEEFFHAHEENEREVQALRRLLRSLAEQEEQSGLHDPLDLTVIKYYLRTQGEKDGFGFGFLTGGVTFCTLLPMRSIPFKVICLVGMNNDSYPRESSALTFDLMEHHPRPGDPSRRNDDRYLFLEALLSAREKLYMSYVGQSIQDNSPIPPSVVVSELLEYVERGFTVARGKVRDHVVTTHRLQAFSPAYFTRQGKLFSYSEDNCQAAQLSLKARKKPRPFIENSLSEPGKENRTVDLEGLCRFFSNPSRFLLNQRLGLYLDEGAPLMSDTELLQVKGLEKYNLEQRLLEKCLSGGDMKEFFHALNASGKLPHGNVGAWWYEHLRAQVMKLAAIIMEHKQEKHLESLDAEINLGAFKLTGRVDSIFPSGLLHYRYAKARARDHIKLWLHHLVLCTLAGEGYPRESVLIALAPNSGESPPSIWRYRAPDNGYDIVGSLLEHYWKGLSKPLQFFPDSSWAYAYSLLVEEREEAQALHSATVKWTSTEYGRGEGDDPYYQRCFGTTPPFDSEFQRISRAIFGPLLRHQGTAR